MIKPIINTQTVILILVVLNLIFVFIFKTHRRYFLGQSILFVVFISAFLAWNNFVFPHFKEKIELERKNDETKNAGQLNNEVWLSTQKAENFIYSLNRPTFEASVFQTLFTFLFSLIGFKQTNEKKLFRILTIVFGILSLIFTFLYFLASITPAGMVTYWKQI